MLFERVPQSFCKHRQVVDGDRDRVSGHDLAFLITCRSPWSGVMVALVVRPEKGQRFCLANIRFSVTQMGRRRLGELMTKAVLTRSIRAWQGKVDAVRPNTFDAKRVLGAVGFMKP